DVAAVAAADLPTTGVAMAWASFPCQDLSLAGGRRGLSATRSGAFWPFWRLLRDLHATGTRPPLVVVENVVGLLSGPDFAALGEALAELDLRFGALVIDAVQFLPQSRPRVFIVAVDARLPLGALAAPEPEPGPWLTASLRRAHDGLPGSLRQRWVWWRLPVPPPMTARVADLIEDDPVGVDWHPPAETTRLLEMMTPVNRAKVERAGAASTRRVGLLYKRTRDGRQRAEVRFDGVAGCLRTATGGSSRQTVLIVEGGAIRSRLLSPREAARLMGLPDDFRLPSAYNAAYHAMGDGVAAPAVAWLGKHLLTPLARAAPSFLLGQPLAPRLAAASPVPKSLAAVAD
ncbi:MAG: DNA cytosine methyltransferase, partial [Thermomicrobiales bacterium]|nr:DNA cytosine methyltransferase [Thermomicrobiales bacterium]